MPSTYDLETRGGVRRVEFDPDVFRSRDVRILVDGNRAAAMPYPTAAAPYQESPSSSAITPSWLMHRLAES